MGIPLSPSPSREPPDRRPVLAASAMDRELVWIDDAEACREACADLSQAPEELVAVDLEGTNLSRECGFCLLQAARREGPIYLFDVLRLGRSGFEAGLRQLLERNGPRKLLFDPRADADALSQQYGVLLGNVLDVQVLHCWAAGQSCSSYLPGMAKATGCLHSVSAELREQLTELKEQGRRLFKPELGGDRAVWEERPLPELLWRYAAADVDVLFAMYGELAPQVDACKVQEVSERRLGRHLQRDTLETGPHRDFPVPSDFQTVFVKGKALLRTSDADLAWHLSKFGKVSAVPHRECSGDFAFAFVEFAEVSGALTAVRESAKAKHRGRLGSVQWPKRVGAFIEDYLTIATEEALQ